MSIKSRGRKLLAGLVVLSAALATGGAGQLMGNCGPFTDVAADAFCAFVLEIFYLGITTGTTATTYDPASNVTRLQMAAFLSRTVDGTLKRGSRRAAMNRFWTPQGSAAIGVTTIGAGPGFLSADGVDVWAATGSNTVARVRAGDGKYLESWTGATNAHAIMTAIGRVFATGNQSPGALYRIDPSQPAGAVTTVASNLGNAPSGIAFDGGRLWTADFGGSVSIITPGPGIPYSVNIVSSGFGNPNGIVFDGSRIWVTDFSPGTLLKLDFAGAILQTVTVGPGPTAPIFDGNNIWVPTFNPSSVSVVRASTGVVLATLTGNGLGGPAAAAFDGERILVTNPSLNSVSLWKAADFTPLGSFSTGAATQPLGVCSDGVNFWIGLASASQIARF